MALDVYVMPLWRFKVGDFESPITQALGIAPVVLTIDAPDGPVTTHRSGLASWWRRGRARREVEAIRRTVERENGVSARWNDNGPIAYSRQGHSFEALRAYARWLDCRDRFPTFDEPPEKNYYKHPVMKEQIPSPRFPHLTGHSCFNGYYLPVDFETIVSVEPYMILGRWPAHRQVGSSLRLMNELEIIHEVLQTPCGYLRNNDDPLADVKVAYQQLREVAELSCRHGLPVIFHG